MATTKPKVADYEQAAYDSQYQGQMDAALNNVTNRQEFSYDPLKDANYQALAKMYQKQGQQASQNALGDAASLNGGLGSSFALTASQQAQNDFNQQLASQIPALQDAAYNKYMNNYNMNLSALDALRAADDSAYGKYRDTVGDKQWQYGADYQGYRDDVGDTQWQTAYDRGVLESDRSFDYQKSRDAVSDKQWAQEFALSKKAASNGNGSRNVRDFDIGSDDNVFRKLWDALNKKKPGAVGMAAIAATAASKGKKKK